MSEAPSYPYAAPTPAASEGSRENSPLAPSLVISLSPDDVSMHDEEEHYEASQPPDSPLYHSMRPPMLNPQLFKDPSNGRIPTPLQPSFAPRYSLPRNDVEDVDDLSSNVTLQELLKRQEESRGRRLPSPISESGDPETPTALTSSQLSRLNMRADEVMDVDEDLLDGGISPLTPVRKTGRSRSGAIAMEKKKYVMGYRDDCEKCRMRVPGHFSHFLPA